MNIPSFKSLMAMTGMALASGPGCVTDGSNAATVTTDAVRQMQIANNVEIPQTGVKFNPILNPAPSAEPNRAKLQQLAAAPEGTTFR